MKKIVIDPVTRIEGHTKISIYLDDDGILEMIYKVNVEERRGSGIIIVIRAYIAPSLICVKGS
jgi:coenzyme F420-reducing hydrogenase alpha subunit